MELKMELDEPLRSHASELSSSLCCRSLCPSACVLAPLSSPITLSFMKSQRLSLDCDVVEMWRRDRWEQSREARKAQLLWFSSARRRVYLMAQHQGARCSSSIVLN